MNKIIKVAATIYTAGSLFMASGIGEAIKNFIAWVFDKSCDPDKFDHIGRIFM